MVTVEKEDTDLGEEIINILTNNKLSDINVRDDIAEGFADDIINTFKKRIDKEIKKYPTLENFSKLGGKSSDDYRVEALTELKKELLK